MASAKRCRIGCLPLGPSAAHAGKARRAADTAAAISSAPPAETSAIREQSIGEITSKVRADSIRLPSIQCAVETSTPATLARAFVLASFTGTPPLESDLMSQRLWFGKQKWSERVHESAVRSFNLPRRRSGAFTHRDKCQKV